MGRDLQEIFVRSGRYALFCPILFLIPVVAELIQHAIEIRGGMYVDSAGMRAAGEDMARLAFGHAKVITLFLTGYWAARFLVFGDDAGAARRFDPRAVRLFVPVMAWGLFWLVALQDGPLIPAAAGVPAKPAAVALLTVVVGTLLFEPLLAAWKTAAAAGNPAIGFVRSIRSTRPVYLRALGLSMLPMLPLMAAHYALAFAAVGAGTVPLWLLMGLDAVLVGALSVVMTASAYIIARRVGDRAGVDLAAVPPLPAARAAVA